MISAQCGHSMQGNGGNVKAAKPGTEAPLVTMTGSPMPRHPL